MGNRLTDDVIAVMYADHQSGLSWAELGRKYKRDRACLRMLFSRRGLALRPSKGFTEIRTSTGTFAPAVPLTAIEVTALIESATKLAVPVALKLEWRKWSLARRGDFIRRLRAKLGRPLARPAGPFSNNVEPFDYSTERAHAVMKKMNSGRDSRTAAVKINICSEGVIWREEIWCWMPDTGYTRGPWTQQATRPLLHRCIYESHHKVKLGSNDVVIFIDGNDNNLDPANLQVISRETLCRQNQAATLLNNSRDLTSILLNRHNKKATDENPDSFTSLRQSQ